MRQMLSSGNVWLNIRFQGKKENGEIFRRSTRALGIDEMRDHRNLDEPKLRIKIGRTLKIAFMGNKFRATITVASLIAHAYTQPAYRAA